MVNLGGYIFTIKYKTKFILQIVTFCIYSFVLFFLHLALCDVRERICLIWSSQARMSVSEHRSSTHLQFKRLSLFMRGSQSGGLDQGPDK